MGKMLLPVFLILIFGCDNTTQAQAEYVCRDHGGVYFRNSNGWVVCEDRTQYRYLGVVLPEKTNSHQ